MASFKGGVGKTTTAVHIGAYLQHKAPTVLIDGDANRSASAWARHGKLPFQVHDEKRLPKAVREFENVVLDTAARPQPDELRDLVGGCDLLIIPTTADMLAMDALMQTVEALEALGADQYRILLTIIPPRPSRDGDEAREALSRAKLPLFKTAIRRLVAFQKAALAGVPVSDVDDPRAAEAWSDYVAVAKEITR